EDFPVIIQFGVHSSAKSARLHRHTLWDRKSMKDIFEHGLCALELSRIDQGFGNIRGIPGPFVTILPEARIEPASIRNGRPKSHRGSGEKTFRFVNNPLRI